MSRLVKQNRIENERTPVFGIISHDPLMGKTELLSRCDIYE